MRHAVDHAPPRKRPLLALLIRLGAIAALSTLAALIKYASNLGVHLGEILFWRQAVFLPIALAWIWLSTGSFALLATKRPGAHLRRGLLGLVGMVLNFGAVILLPLAEATTLSFSAPIWAVLLSALLLKDKVGIWRWSAVVLGFLGIVVIAQPGSGHFPLYGTAVALGAAFMVALISIQIADLGRTEKPLTIVFYFSFVTVPILALGLPFFAQAHSSLEWGLLIAIGLVGSVAQLLLTAALRLGTVASVIVMDYSGLFWATLYGFAIWGVLPTAATWLGAPLVIGAGLLITWREHTLARRRFADQRQAVGGT